MISIVDIVECFLRSGAAEPVLHASRKPSLRELQGEKNEKR